MVCKHVVWCDGGSHVYVTLTFSLLLPNYLVFLRFIYWCIGACLAVYVMCVFMAWIRDWCVCDGGDGGGGIIVIEYLVTICCHYYFSKSSIIDLTGFMVY